jgi:hypothetical protein
LIKAPWIQELCFCVLTHMVESVVLGFYRVQHLTGLDHEGSDVFAQVQHLVADLVPSEQTRLAGKQPTTCKQMRQISMADCYQVSSAMPSPCASFRNIGAASTRLNQVAKHQLHLAQFRTTWSCGKASVIHDTGAQQRKQHEVTNTRNINNTKQ